MIVAGLTRVLEGLTTIVAGLTSRVLAVGLTTVLTGLSMVVEVGLTTILAIVLKHLPLIRHLLNWRFDPHPRLLIVRYFTLNKYYSKVYFIA